MKLLYFLLLTLFSLSAFSQTDRRRQFEKSLLELISDANNGFTNTSGELVEDISWHGKKFRANNAIFNDTGKAGVQWIRPMQNTYAPSTSESYFFFQNFLPSTADGQFMMDSLEKILDELAVTAKLVKDKKNIDKKYKKEWKTYNYRGANSYRNVFSITYYLKEKAVSISIYSPYRPGSVPVPKFLGTMGIFTVNNKFMQVVPVYAESLGNEADVAASVFKFTGLGEKEYTYQWFNGRTAKYVMEEYKTLNPRLHSDFHVQK